MPPPFPWPVNSHASKWKSHSHDCGKHYEYVQECHLPLDGIDREALHHIGLRNLRALVAQRQAQCSRIRTFSLSSCVAISRRASSCSTICRMVSLGGSSKASMQRRSQLATCSFSATALQQMACGVAAYHSAGAARGRPPAYEDDLCSPRW